MKTVFCIDWNELNDELGGREDGFSLHLTRSDAEYFVEKHHRSKPDARFREFSVPAGDPYVVGVPDELYREVCSSSCGLRRFRPRQAMFPVVDPATLPTPPPRLRLVSRNSGLLEWKDRLIQLPTNPPLGGWMIDNSESGGLDLAVVEYTGAMPGELVYAFHKRCEKLSAMDHPGISRLLDYVYVEDIGMLTLWNHEPNTESLAQGLARPVVHDQILKVFGDAASAMDYAYQNGVIHGALLPELLMANRTTTQIAGFSAIELTGKNREFFLNLRSDRSVRPVPSKVVIYRPPEWIQGRPTDFRSEIYTFGAILYSVLCQRYPFDDSTEQLLLAKRIITSQPDDLPKRVAQWQDFVFRCMAKKPDDRFDDWRNVIEALQAI